MTYDELDLLIEAAKDEIIKRENERIEKELEELEKVEIHFSDEHNRKMQEIFDSLRDGTFEEKYHEYL